MKIQIELELNDVKLLLQAFSDDAYSKTICCQARAKLVVERIADQVEIALNVLERETEIHKDNQRGLMS